MLEVTDLVCGTKDEVLHYLYDKFSFEERNVETINKSYVNFNGLGEQINTIEKQIDEIIAMDRPIGPIAWLKNGDWTVVGEMPQLNISIEMIYVLIRKF